MTLSTTQAGEDCGWVQEKREEVRSRTKKVYARTCGFAPTARWFGRTFSGLLFRYTAAMFAGSV
jgi:hypothetical protein